VCAAPPATGMAMDVLSPRALSRNLRAGNVLTSAPHDYLSVPSVYRAVYSRRSEFAAAISPRIAQVRRPAVARPPTVGQRPTSGRRAVKVERVSPPADLQPSPPASPPADQRDDALEMWLCQKNKKKEKEARRLAKVRERDILFTNNLLQRANQRQKSARQHEKLQLIAADLQQKIQLVPRVGGADLELEAIRAEIDSLVGQFSLPALTAATLPLSHEKEERLAALGEQLNVLRTDRSTHRTHRSVRFAGNDLASPNVREPHQTRDIWNTDQETAWREASANRKASVRTEDLLLGAFQQAQARVAWRAVVDPTKRHLQSTLLEPTAAAKEKEALKNLGDDAQAAYAVASLMAKRRRGRGRRVEDIAPRE
jgi:hypothetical protein